MTTTRSKSASLAIVAGVYAVAVVVMVGVASLFDDVLWGVVAGDLAATLVVFVAGTAYDNGSLYDAYWSVIPPVAAGLWWADAEGVDGTRTAAVLVVVGLWAIRLTANWVRDWPGLHHEDWRYTELYEGKSKHVIRFTAVMLFPTLIVLVAMLPMWVALHEPGRAFGALDVVATIVGLAGVALELVADEQMRRFGRTKQPGQIMDRGLWRHARHPNYLGELLFWTSLWLFAAATGTGWWWTVVGPLAILAMFLGASIPMLDRRSAERRPAFAEHAARTRAMVPLPRLRQG